MSPAEIAESLHNQKLRNRLDWYETQIHSRSKSLSSIFIELRDDPLKPWKLIGETYEDYCKKAWNMSPRRIQQIAAGESIKALLAEEAPELAETIKQMPEGQTRELGNVDKDKRADILRDAASQPGKMTAAKIKDAKARAVLADPVFDDEDSPPAENSAESLATPAPQETESGESRAEKKCPHCGGILE